MRIIEPHPLGRNHGPNGEEFWMTFGVQILGRYGKARYNFTYMDATDIRHLDMYPPTGLPPLQIEHHWTTVWKGRMPLHVGAHKVSAFCNQTLVRSTRLPVLHASQGGTRPLSAAGADWEKYVQIRARPTLWCGSWELLQQVPQRKFTLEGMRRHSINSAWIWQVVQDPQKRIPEKVIATMYFSLTKGKFCTITISSVQDAFKICAKPTMSISNSEIVCGHWWNISYIPEEYSKHQRPKWPSSHLSKIKVGSQFPSLFSGPRHAQKYAVKMMRIYAWQWGIWVPHLDHMSKETKNSTDPKTCPPNSGFSTTWTSTFCQVWSLFTWLAGQIDPYIHVARPTEITRMIRSISVGKWTPQARRNEQAVWVFT